MAGRGLRASLMVLMLAPTPSAVADDFDPRVACWSGDLLVCELGLMEHPGDIRWLAVANWAYINSDQQDRARDVSDQFSRAINKIGYSLGALQRVAREDLAAGAYRQAALAYEVLLDFEEEAILLNEINHTGGNPQVGDDATQEAIDAAIRSLRHESYEGRGLALIMLGDADAGLADLRSALEYGRLRETRRMIESLGIDYEPQDRFGIAAIDAELERVLREIADAQAAD